MQFICLLILEYQDSDASPSTSAYSPSLDTSYEDFEPDPDSLSFRDQCDDIMDAIKDYYKESGITRLKAKIIMMLNSNTEGHTIPRRYVEKLSKCKCKTTDSIFEYFSPYIKKDNPAVLRIIVEASGCKKAKDLCENHFG